MFKPTVLVTALISLALCPSDRLDAQDLEARLEFRLATDAKTDDWQETKVRGSDQPIFVSNEVALRGHHIDKVSFSKGSNGDWSIGITLTDDGAKAMKEVTERNLKKKLAIVLNGKVVVAPTIQSTISKEVLITGRFDKDDLLKFFHAIVLQDVPETAKK